MSPVPRPGPVILAAILHAVLVAIASSMPRFRISPVHVQSAWWAYRITQRIKSVMRRFAEGRLAPPRPRRGRARASAPGKPRERLDLPRFANWLCPLAPGVSCYGTQIAYLFETNPEMVAMAAAAPQLGRALRPLLRALGAPIPPALRAPPRPSAPPRPAGTNAAGEDGAGNASGDTVGTETRLAAPAPAWPPPLGDPRDAASGGGS